MLKLKPLSILLTMIALSSCHMGTININIAPENDSHFSREISVKPKNPAGMNEGLPPQVENPNIYEEAKELIVHMLGFYDKKEQYQPPKEVFFEGKFNAPPPDIVLDGNKNRGEYHTLSCPLGAARYYRETFPSRMTPYQDFQSLVEGVDICIDGIVYITEKELKGEKGEEKLVAFLQDDLKKDIHNLLFIYQGLLFSLTSSHNEANPTNDKTEETLAWWFSSYAIQLLQDQGYITSQELAEIIKNQQEKDQEYWITFVVEKIAGIMEREHDKELIDKLVTIVHRYIELEEREFFQAAKIDADLMKHKINVDWLLLSNYFLIDFTLKSSSPPVITNGIWLEEKKCIAWQGKVLKNQIIPLIFYAVWSEPNIEKQQKHFGKVVLTGRELSELVFKYQQATDKEQKGFNDILTTLNPKENLVEQMIAASDNDLIRFLHDLLSVEEESNLTEK